MPMTNLENTEWICRNPLVRVKLTKQHGEYWIGEVKYPDSKGGLSTEMWDENLNHLHDSDLDLIERIGWRAK